jgi:copper(I)-binding protein
MNAGQQMYIRTFFFTLGVTALLGGTSLANEAPVKLEHGWVRAVPPSSSDTVAYMSLVNTSSEPLRLTGGSTTIAEMLMPMITTKRTMSGQEIMGMKAVDALVIPAHGQLTLTPEGDHLMLMMLKEHPKPGEKVKLILHFEPGGKDLTVELPVALKKP